MRLKQTSLCSIGYDTVNHVFYLMYRACMMLVSADVPYPACDWLRG